MSVPTQIAHSCPQPRLTGRRSARQAAATIIAWGFGAPLLLLLGGGTILHVVSGGDISTTSVVLPIAGMTSLSVGELLVTRLPRHRIAWLLWLIGTLISINVITQALADLGLNSEPGTVPGALWFAWVAGWAGGLALFVPPILLPLLYPTGQPPSRRWRPVVIAGIIAIGAWALAAALSPFPDGTYPPDVRNPLALAGAPGDVLAQLRIALNPILFLLLVLALASVAVRYRRAIGVEREQIRWFAFVGSIAILALAVAGGASGISDDPGATIDSLAWLAGIGAIALFPVAIGIAVLRYRLYEIDRLVSRTISWAIVTTILGGVFVGLILVVQAALAAETSSSTVAVAASTLVVAALFQPVRRSVQARVDRRFNRARYDAERTVAAFTGRLRDEVDLEVLRAEVLRTLEVTLEPESASIWLRG